MGRQSSSCHVRRSVRAGGGDAGHVNGGPNMVTVTDSAGNDDGSNPNWKHAVIHIDGMKFTGATLAEAMQKVREWKGNSNG